MIVRFKFKLLIKLRLLVALLKELLLVKILNQEAALAV